MEGATQTDWFHRQNVLPPSDCTAAEFSVDQLKFRVKPDYPSGMLQTGGENRKHLSSLVPLQTETRIFITLLGSVCGESIPWVQSRRAQVKIIVLSIPF